MRTFDGYEIEMSGTRSITEAELAKVADIVREYRYEDGKFDIRVEINDDLDIVIDGDIYIEWSDYDWNDPADEPQEMYRNVIWEVYIEGEEDYWYLDQEQENTLYNILADVA